MNKMFKKIFAVVAACATVATMAVSAFAADYKPTDSAITVTPVTTPTDASMYTVMLFKTNVAVTGDAETVKAAVAAATPAVADIYYINQGTVLADLVTGMLVKATTVDETTTYLPEGNYIARIGNDKGSVENLIVTVEDDAVSFTYGDVNGDGKTDTADALQILYFDSNLDSCFDDDAEWRMLAGEVTGDGKVDTADALQILYYDSNLDSTLDNLLKK